jgi:LysR family glycine cleavage system transcriptional activator
MVRNIPPFAALRAFDALARRGSLRAAGEELSVSASAVSHQLNALEDHLGARLLFKSGNRLKFTETGKRLADELREGLNLLEQASLRASARPERSRISICLFQSLAELWLVPLLGAFNRQEPDVVVSVITEPEVIELSGTDIDLAIQYGDKAHPNHQLMELFPETIEPLACKDYLVAAGHIEQPGDILRHRLIFCTCAPDEWQIWSAQKGVPLAKVQRWLEVDTRAAALQAAEQGLGLVMGRRPFSDLAVARRRLIQLFDEPVSTGVNYFIIVPKRSWSSPHVRHFCSWLQTAAHADNPFGLPMPARAETSAENQTEVLS